MDMKHKPNHFKKKKITTKIVFFTHMQRHCYYQHQYQHQHQPFSSETITKVCPALKILRFFAFLMLRLKMLNSLSVKVFKNVKKRHLLKVKISFLKTCFLVQKILFLDDNKSCIKYLIYDVRTIYKVLSQILKYMVALIRSNHFMETGITKQAGMTDWLCNN